MPEHVRLLEHTADLGIEACAGTPAAAAQALGLKLADLACDGVALGPEREAAVDAGGLDATETLVAWLNELLYTLQSKALRATAIDIDQCTATHIAARVRGVDVDPRLHRHPREIKAVTYHRALFAPAPDGWVARVYLDL